MSDPDLNRLQGQWFFVSLEVDGSSFPSAMLAGSQMAVEEDRFTMISGGLQYAGHFRLDPASEPATIDIHFTAGPEAGNYSSGIYRLEDDAWTVCLGLAGRDRPRAFATRPGSGHALEVLRREAVSRVGAPPTGTGANEDDSDLAAVEDPDLERMQGEWSLVFGSLDGRDLEPQWAVGMRRVAAGRKLRVTVSGQSIIQAEIHLRADAEPAEIDYLLTSGPNRGNRQLGIYRWDGPEVTFCMAAVGSERPRRFEATAGSGLTLTRWKPA